MSDIKLDSEKVARLTHDFLETDLGKHHLAQLSVQYNGLHQEAESEKLSIEQKALKIERAAGLKIAIDLLTGPERLLAQGYFEKVKPAKQ